MHKFFITTFSIDISVFFFYAINCILLNMLKGKWDGKIALRKCSGPITPYLFNLVTSNNFYRWLLQLLVWNYIKRRIDNKNFYIFCCVWYNTWCWTHSVNWAPMRTIFYFIRILAPWINRNFFWVNSDN